MSYMIFSWLGTVVTRVFLLKHLMLPAANRMASLPQGHKYVLRTVAKVRQMEGKNGRTQICRRAQCN
jgi:hypothetical protein